MDLTKILEYQKLDLVIYKAEKDFNNSDENKMHVRLRNAISEILETLVRYDKEASDVYSDIERLKGEFDNYVKKSKATSFSGAKTLDQIDKMDDSVASLEKELDNIERALKRSFARLEEIAKESNELIAKNSKYRQDFKLVDIARNKKRQEILSSIANEGKMFNDMKAILDPNDLAIYNKAKQAKVKMPIIVPYNDGNCAACGMEIKSEVDAKLQNVGDIAECPHCRRIVYKK